MTYTVTDIKWDTDGENVDLPNEVNVYVPDELDEQIEIEEFISNYITNETGFCHFGYSVNPPIE